MKQIKLLALDVDGTLLNSRGEITPANTKAIREAEEAGVLVTIATGRRFRDAQPVAIEADLNAPILTHNGALIKYAESLETISSETLESATVLEILSFGKEYGGDPLVSTDPNGNGTLLYESIADENIPLKRYIEWAQRLHGTGATGSVINVSKLEISVSGAEVIHISFSGNCAAMETLKGHLERELKDNVNILATVYPARDFTLLDVLPPGSSKAAGLSRLAEILEIESEHIMAIGDNFNDLEMLEYAGTSVVMGNADRSLITREEFYTTLNNEESGVAAAINEHILGVTNGK